MRQDEATWVVFTFFCDYYNEHGEESRVGVNSAYDSIKNLGVTRAQVRVAVTDLLGDGTIRLIRGFPNDEAPSGNYYAITVDGCRKWEEENAQRAQMDAQEEEDLWQPLEVEDYEDRANELDALADVLDKDNGYKGTKPDEADYTISTTRGFAKVLRETGRVVKKRAVEFLALLVRLATRYTIKTIVGQMVDKATSWLKKLVESLPEVPF